MLNNEDLHFKPSNSDDKVSKDNKFCATPFSDAEISAKVKFSLLPSPIKSKHKPQAFKEERRSKIPLENGKLPKLSDSNYQLPKPKLRQLSSANKSTVPLSGLSTSKDEYGYNLPLLGDLKPQILEGDSIKLIKNKDSSPRGIKEDETNHLLQETSMSSVLFNSTPLRPKMCKSNLKSQLEVAEKKLRAIKSLVSGWEVNGTTENIQMLLEEIKRNL